MRKVLSLSGRQDDVAGVISSKISLASRKAGFTVPGE